MGLFGPALIKPADVLAQEAPAPLPLFHGTSKPYTRWWWLGGPFRHEDIVYQLDWIKANGFGGVELAWLWPSWLGTFMPGPDWLGPEWSDLTAFAKQYADKIGLGCDFTLGSCWPFGGSCVRPEDAAQTFTGPSGQRLVGSWEDGRGAECLVVNHLSRRALENYAAALLPAFAPALRGATSALFCDSLEIESHALWSPDLGPRFTERFGYAVEPFFARLRDHPDVRYDYRKLVAETMCREFFEAFTDLCRRAGAFSRVQCHGALADLLSAYAAVDVPESEAILFNPTFSRIPASAAALAGKPVVSCETFTCIYGFITPRNLEPLRYWRREQVADLKLLADALFAQGVNQVLWHGMPFNGPGDRNEFYASVHVGPDAAFAGELPAFNAYLEAVSVLLKLGRPLGHLAVYLPNEDNWMLDRIPPEERTPAALYRWEMRHAVCPPETTGFAPLWISAPFFKRAACRDGRLALGDLTFAALYVDVAYLDGEALDEILRLARAGVPVILQRCPQQPGHVPRADYADRLRELQALPTVRPTLQAAGLRPLVEGGDLPWYWARQTDGHVYLFFAHPAARDVRYPMGYGQSQACQAVTRRVRLQVRPGTTELKLRFEPYQSLLVRAARDTGKVEFINIRYRPPEPKSLPASVGP
jgi:hypothetical protein